MEFALEKEDVEAEIEAAAEESLIGDECSDTPFDPRNVNVFTKMQVVNLLVRRIRNGALDLHPEFQRSSGIWTNTNKSRLIESLLIRIPIPSLYFDASDDDHWSVIDGLQRLSTIYEFVNDHFKLSNLEFLHDLNGKTYSQMGSKYQTRIDETEIASYLIMPGTPLRVKFDIFRRINTGGRPLCPQEIRHALNNGPCTRLLQAMVETDEFKSAVCGGVSALRMADRECALRYLAFLDQPPEDYRRSSFNLFLCEYMEKFNLAHKGHAVDDPSLRQILDRFTRTMRFASELFGKCAFRLLDKNGVPSGSRVSKALFEAWSVNLAKIDDVRQKVLLDRKDLLIRSFAERLSSDPDFCKSVTQSTGGVTSVHMRFAVVKSLIDEVSYAAKTVS